MNCNVELSHEDEQTILQYKIDVEKQRGYNGPCFVNVQRLAEIHMENAAAITQVCLFRIKHTSKQTG